MSAMTEEQKQFLQWYYRTEDPAPWRFAMLALSCVCLLLGFLLLGLGCMASRNRKKIAKYKAAAAFAQRVEAAELHVVSDITDKGEEELLQEAKPAGNGVAGELQAGDDTVKWKDANMASPYTEEEREEEREEDRGEERKEEGEEEREEERGEEASAAEPEFQEGVRMME